jgi:hypothetical protein
MMPDAAMTELDPVLRRVERNGLIACGVMAAIAWGIARGRVDAPLGVIGGGLLVAVSYRGIKGGIDALVGGMVARSDGRDRRLQAAIGLVKFFTRYAILAAAAYVIMARLRLPPVAVVAGASSFVVAVALEAVRGITSRRR